jgi:hypothetical protein
MRAQFCLAYLASIVVVITTLVPSVVAENRFSRFIGAHLEKLPSAVETCEVGKACVFRLPLPKTRSGKEVYTPRLYVSPALHSKSEVLAGLDVLLDLHPIRVDAAFRPHKQLGQIKEVFLKTKKTRVYAKRAGNLAIHGYTQALFEIYIGNETKAKFLTLASEGVIEKGDFAQLVSDVEYLESLKLSFSQEGESLRVRVRTSNNWREKGHLAPLVVGVEVTKKNKNGYFLEEFALLEARGPKSVADGSARTQRIKSGAAPLQAPLAPQPQTRSASAVSSLESAQQVPVGPSTLSLTTIEPSNVDQLLKSPASSLLPGLARLVKGIDGTNGTLVRCEDTYDSAVRRFMQGFAELPPRASFTQVSAPASAHACRVPEAGLLAYRQRLRSEPDFRNNLKLFGSSDARQLYVTSRAGTPRCARPLRPSPPPQRLLNLSSTTTPIARRALLRK